MAALSKQISPSISLGQPPHDSLGRVVALSDSRTSYKVHVNTMQIIVLILLPLCLVPACGGSTNKVEKSNRYTSMNENADAGLFSDLSPSHDGGVANPTDGSTGNALQQTLIDAYFWGVAHNGARATVVVASEYPVSGSRILVPGNVDLVCSSYSPHTYTGGCSIIQTDAGNNTTSGGSPLLVADFSIGVLADHKTRCSTYDQPAKVGCIIISSSGGSISGFTLYGGGANAGGADVGIRVAANNFSVQDTAITGFFGGPGIQEVDGVNNSYDWNYGTNVDVWWCQHSSQMTPGSLSAALLIGDGNLGGIELSIVDGEASHNQYSTGCAFSKGFTVSLEYPRLAAMHVSGAGSLIQDNLLQVDGLALIVSGEEQRVLANRFEYQAREAVLSYASDSLFSGNHILSACLDGNLPILRPGAPNNGIPTYPVSPRNLHPGYLIRDSNGNVEQDVYGNQSYGYGMTGTGEPGWATNFGETIDTPQIVWENSGPWIPGMTASTDSGPVPEMTSGLCYGVKDYGQNNSWGDNQVGQEVAVDGPSYMRGSYFIGFPGVLTGNSCDQDQPDASGNGQCWWGGDLFSSGGPDGLQPNGKRISASGGGTAWVGDYSVVVLTDTTPRIYSDFQGMSSGQFFWVTSSNVSNVVASWGVNGSGSLYGHPSLLTCGAQPLTVTPNAYYEFYYNPTNPWMITQVDCAQQAPSGTLSLSPTMLTFLPQAVGATGAAQIAKLTNTSTVAVALSIVAAGDFGQTNSCATALAPGASCTITVSFTPTAAGINTGSLTVTNTFNGSNTTIGLSGMGTVVANPNQPAIKLSASGVLFSTQASGTTSSPQVISITNPGTTGVPTAIAVTGDFAQVNNCGTTIAGGSTCAASITFTPTVPGKRSGAFNLTNKHDGSSYAIPLTGMGEIDSQPSSPVMNLSNGSLTFAPQRDGTTSESKTLEISNLGNVSFKVNLSIKGDFSDSSACSQILQHGDKCMVAVQFKPTAAGARAGLLTIVDTISNSTQAVVLTGTGTVDAAPPSSGTSKTIAVSSTVASMRLEGLDKSATAPFYISSIGGFTGDVRVTCTIVYLGTGKPNDEPSCSLTPPSTFVSADVQSLSTLTVTIHRPATAAEQSKPQRSSRYVIANLLLIGLLSGAGRHRSLFVACLCLGFMGGAIGCGVTYNRGESAASVSTSGTPTEMVNNYNVLVTATSGTLTSFLSMPLSVQ